MSKYKETIIKLIKNFTYIVPLIIVAIAGYGYVLTHPTVNVDVLAAEKYYEGTELIAQSRLMGPILEKLFNVMDFNPFFVDFIAVLFLMIAALLFCALFEEVSRGKIKTIAYTIFSCFFISYPLIMQIFNYTPMGLSIALGFCFVAIAIMAFYEFLKAEKKSYLIFSSIILWCSISLYESFATVYVMGVLAVLLIKILFANKEKVSLKVHIIEGIKYLIPLVIAVLFNTIITKLVLTITGINESTNADKGITYFTLGIVEGIKNLIHTVIIDYGINALGYLPITFLVISVIVCIIMAIVLSVKKKDISIIIICLGMCFTLLLLSVIRGGSAPYRTCQQFQLFIAVIFMVLTSLVLSSNIKKGMKNILLVIVFVMIFYQVKDLYNWQYLNDLRYQKEKFDVMTIGNELKSKYNIEKKPVVFIGGYELSDNLKKRIIVQPKTLHYKVLNYYNNHFYNKKIKDTKDYKYTQTIQNSYVNWGIRAFLGRGTPNIELKKLFSLLGYDIEIGDYETYNKALAYYRENKLPKWPKEGSIAETDEFIVVML